MFKTAFFQEVCFELGWKGCNLDFYYFANEGYILLIYSIVFKQVALNYWVGFLLNGLSVFPSHKSSFSDRGVAAYTLSQSWTSVDSLVL